MPAFPEPKALMVGRRKQVRSMYMRCALAKRISRK